METCRMIKAKAPCRISICGGSSDLSFYWRRNGGFLVTATIDQYVTVEIQPDNRIDTSPQHPYATAAGWGSRDLVLIESSVAPGSGLGGSSSLMVALLRARYPDLPVHELAMAAYHAERFGQIEAPVGYQDAFAAAFGGVLAMEIDNVGRVSTWHVALPPKFRDHLLLMATGIQRPSSDVLRKQEAATITSIVSRKAMESIAQLGHEIYADIRDNQGCEFGPLLDRHWQYKRAVASSMSSPVIDAWYDLAKGHGASGAKLIGAGGSGGYLLFVVEPSNRQHLVDTMIEAGLTEMPFKFTDKGAEIIP